MLLTALLIGARLWGRLIAFLIGLIGWLLWLRWLIIGLLWLLRLWCRLVIGLLWLLIALIGAKHVAKVGGKRYMHCAQDSTGDEYEGNAGPPPSGGEEKSQADEKDQALKSPGGGMSVIRAQRAKECRGA